MKTANETAGKAMIFAKYENIAEQKWDFAFKCFLYGHVAIISIIEYFYLNPW